jgi:hypothetical protein
MYITTSQATQRKHFDRINPPQADKQDFQELEDRMKNPKQQTFYHESTKPRKHPSEIW